VREFGRGRLPVIVLRDRPSLGVAAAAFAGARLVRLLGDQPTARVVFAAAPSQGEMLRELATVPGIDWGRVHAFHLDEYVGLSLGDRRSFGDWLDRAIWSRVRPGRVERLNGDNAAGPAAEAARYASLLCESAIDLALVGVGENGHVAFNDPHMADFQDPEIVRLVELDETSRRQQVHDGTFERLVDVPQSALTVTMSMIRSCRTVSIVVSGPRKSAAVAAMLDGPIDPACPASVLRDHADAVLFLDEPAASLVTP
jgi:glucosamine-6-phosphate deaminase